MIFPTILKKILLPLGLLACFAGMWFGLYRPEMARINEYRTQPLATRQQIEQMTRQLSVYQKPSEEERAEWLRLEREISQKIPWDREITSLYASLSELAEKHGLVDFQRQIREEAAAATPPPEDGIPRQSFELELTFQSGFDSLKFRWRKIRFRRIVREKAHGLPAKQV